MDRALNPFNPGAGLTPPALVGRTSELETFDTIVARARVGLISRSIVLTGLRGVGKTVLLNAMADRAVNMNWFVGRLEARNDEKGATSVRARLARELVIAARRLGPPKKLSGKLQNALGTIAGFNAKVGATGVDLGVQITPGRADSGEVDVDLLELIEDVSIALIDRGLAFALFIDEMQDLENNTLTALLAAQHAAGQRNWPFYLLGAGLPSLPRVLSEHRTYAERLFDYRPIGALNQPDAEQGLAEPIARFGARIEPAALRVLTTAAEGYPYFLQEYGQAVWNLAPDPTFTAADAQAAIVLGQERLDAAFYSSRWERATRAERTLLVAMAADNGAPSTVSAIASRLGRTQNSLGPARASLIAKGLVYAPDYGQLAFTVPGMAAFVGRRADQT